MEKTIRIGNNEIRMRASALIPRLYRNKFGRDVISDMRKLQTSVSNAEQLDIADLTIFENIAWLMCRHADDTVPDDPDEWLDGIDGVFSVYEILPEILELWSQSQQTTSVPRKKVRATTREPNGAQFMLRCAEFGLSDEALSNMTMGMVYDMCIEKANDYEKYPYKATQEDIYAFFGRG